MSETDRERAWKLVMRCPTEPQSIVDFAEWVIGDTDKRIAELEAEVERLYRQSEQQVDVAGKALIRAEAAEAEVERLGRRERALNQSYLDELKKAADRIEQLVPNRADHHPGCYSIDPPTSGNWECNCGYGLQRKIAELEAERDFLAKVQEELYDTLTEAGADKANDISERLALLIHDRDRLRDALRKYGSHQFGCDADAWLATPDAPCTCGFIEALNPDA